jgi:hypothetical protein
LLSVPSAAPRRDAAIDLDADVAVADHRAQPSDFRQHGGDEGLAAEAGVHRHSEDQIHMVEHIGDGLLGGGRVERHAGLQPERADRLQRAVQMHPGFHRHGDAVDTGAGEGLQIGINRADHQMRVEALAAVAADRPHQFGAEGDVGDEMPVHHIEMDPVRPGRVGGAHLLTEAGEVGREDGRGDQHVAGHGGSCGRAGRARQERPLPRRRSGDQSGATMQPRPIA